MFNKTIADAVASAVTIIDNIITVAICQVFIQLPSFLLPKGLGAIRKFAETILKQFCNHSKDLLRCLQSFRKKAHIPCACLMASKVKVVSPIVFGVSL